LSSASHTGIAVTSPLATGHHTVFIFSAAWCPACRALEGHLPRFLAAVHPRYQVPHRAELAVGLVVAVLAASIDLRAAIGFSSFAVLTYYAIANAAALTLKGKVRAALGLAGCVVLAFSLPLPSVLAGGGVLVLGASAYGVRRIRR